MPSITIHVVANGKISLFPIAEKYSILYVSFSSNHLASLLFLKLSSLAPIIGPWPYWKYSFIYPCDVLP